MDQSRKLPIFQNLVETARQQSQRTEHMSPRTMPASVVSVSGQIVTVKFEVKSEFNLPQIQVPIFGSEYIRIPVQPGCKGILIPSDYYLGGISGLGAGTATLAKQGNLSNLSFFPIGNKNWSSVDKDTLTLYGVKGVEIMDKQGGNSLISIKDDAISMTNGSSSVTVSSNGSEISHGSNSVKADSSGVTVTGTLTINGMEFTAHTHTNGNQGAPTGGVIA